MEIAVRVVEVFIGVPLVARKLFHITEDVRQNVIADGSPLCDTFARGQSQAGRCMAALRVSVWSEAYVNDCASTDCGSS